MKFLSIIVPNFNNALYLDETLAPFLKLEDELKDQIEVLIVDDKSTDNSVEVINKYVNTDSNLYRLIQKEKNGHHGSALNRGIKEANGEWMGFLDADDYYNVEEFPQVFDYLNNTIAESVNFGTKIVFDSPMHIKAAQDKEEQGMLSFLSFNLVPIMGTFFKSELVKDIKIPEGYVYDDIYSDSYIWEKATKIDFNHDIKIFSYRLNRPGQSVEDFSQNYMNVLKIHLYMAYKCIVEISPDYSLRWHVNNVIMNCLKDCGCPSIYFENEDKLIAWINRNIEKLNDEVDYEIVAKNIVKNRINLLSPDFDINTTKLVNFEKAIKQLI